LHTCALITERERERERESELLELLLLGCPRRRIERLELDVTERWAIGWLERQAALEQLARELLDAVGGVGASVRSVTFCALQRRSPTALADGHVREIEFVASTYSPHMHASPPITSAFCAAVPLNDKGSIW